MAETIKFLTYRLTNLPKRLDRDDVRNLFDKEDQSNISAISLGPCPYRPASFNVATVSLKTRSSSEQAPKLPRLSALEPNCEGVEIDDNFLGLTALNTVVGTPQADVIAVTGLAGRAFASWQSESGRMWLRDLLPGELPNVRIFVYGYPSKARQSPSSASIQDFTEGFMREVAKMRSNAADSVVPLILVGHSLGCIVIKQAIVESFSMSARNPQLRRQLCGAVLFGAPHRGLNNPELESAIQGTPPDELVRDLRPNSSLLVSLNQSFPDAARDVKIVPDDQNSKWVKTGPLRFMVPQSSACLDWPKERETKIAIHANHSDMAKLDDSPGSAYHQIKDEIKSICDGAADVMQRRREEEFSGQDTLSLFFVLQYEVSWITAWCSYTMEQPLSREMPVIFTVDEVDFLSFSRIPYGHPAYPVVTEVNLIFAKLGMLLNQHLAQSESIGGTAILPARFSKALTLQQEQSGELYDLSNWSSSDRQLFRDLLTKFHHANDKLSRLGPNMPSLDFVASSNLVSRLSQSALKHVEVIPQAEKLYSSLAKRAALTRQYQHSPSLEDRKAGPMYPIAWIKMKQGAGSSNYRIVTPLNDKSFEAGTARPRWVLVEWRSYKTATTLALRRQAKLQAEKLAHDLSFSNKPPLLKTLACAGFVQDIDEQRFGFLFDLPDGIDIGSEPRTLHSCIPDESGKGAIFPTLSERIRLAQDLAYSVAELHGAGILHKSLHSGNVFFFPARFSKAISVGDAYVGGFEVSRPDQDRQLSLDTQGGRFDAYKHPELRDESNELQGRPASQRTHDVYSLGLILLEIGLWQRLARLHKTALSPAENAKRFLSYARKNLPHLVGRKYCEAVVECIDIERQGLTKNDANDERGGVSLELFVEKVLLPLEACHCRE